MSGAKTVQVSENGTDFFTLPGSTADLSVEGGQLDSTVFGNIFSQSETGLITWNVSANAMYRGFAGYKSSIRSTGSPTPITADLEPDGDYYVIVNKSQSIWDFNSVDKSSFEDSGGPIDAADVEEIDYLFGRVRFVYGFTPDGTVSVNGDYLPTSEFGCANSFSLTQTADVTDTSCFETVQANGGYATQRATLLTADLELTAFYRPANNFFEMLDDREIMVIEIRPDGTDEAIARGFYKTISVNNSGDVGGDEETSVTFGLSAPDDVTPFGWHYGPQDVTPQGLKIVQEAWINRNNVYVKYLPEGSGEPGWEGQAIVTDVSLSSGVEEMVEASITLDGDGALTEI